ncbi:hypothetical protein BCR39DRAFT_503895 [Naematelia encephala]|uniref:C2H2-type domain-containing protein n=1 Tax=Naematelia encephala TaxID=71784 RepID=A0A1Y2BEU4_9TREE|nr:hypothetical protein BCR39DRAFT_503895 [Naematelia encephala]
MDVDAQIDELLSSEEEALVKCEWADCEAAFNDQEGLVKHLHNDHIGAGRDVYMCEWNKCSRRGQKQATRHSLITHIRAHTGERPYTCSVPGCNKTFTRSDALNKHLRSLHDAPIEPPKKKREPSAALTIKPLSLPMAADAELLQDPDLTEVVPRLRARQREWEIDALDKAALATVRSAFSQAAEVDFDEGVSERWPSPVQSVGTVPDPDNPRKLVDVVSRPRWQVRYIMAKAKLMLVDEENAMRRRELAEASALERQAEEEDRTRSR